MICFIISAKRRTLTTTLSTDANGTVSASALYKAFGELRSTPSALGTDYKFTGQREEASLGLYFFVARWFDPSLGRFTSPDTIVPTSTQGTQAWDRYAFVNNNPVRYNDPTGHQIDSGGGVTCYEEFETCSETHTVLVNAHHWMPPYIPGPNESDCGGCSAEGLDEKHPPLPAAAIPGMANDVGIFGINNLATNGKPSIFTFATYSEYSDGSVSVDSLTVHNKSNVDLSISSVTINAEQQGSCSSTCIMPSSATYNVSRYWWINTNSQNPGVGTVPGKSITTISLSPSGYAPNQTNRWSSSFSLTMVIQMAKYRFYRPTIFTIP